MGKIITFEIWLLLRTPKNTFKQQKIILISQNALHGIVSGSIQLSLIDDLIALNA